MLSVRQAFRAHFASIFTQGDNWFACKIHKVTVDLKEMKAASAEAEQQAVREAHARKALAE